jgi:hypothetical protein
MIADGETLRLYRGLTEAFLIGSLRLGVGFAGIAATVPAGMRPRAAFAEAAFGAVVLVLIGIAPVGRMAPWRRRAATLALPAHANREPWWLTLVHASIPSTVTVGAATAAALVFDARLSAFAAGILVGMGTLALLAGIEVAAWERREQSELYLERGPRRRRFVGPSG